MLPKADRDLLVTENLPLVRFLARRYLRHGVELDDLVQEGTIGIIRAAEKFDPSKGRFSAYAGIWIRNKLRNFVQRHGHGAVVRPAWGSRSPAEATRDAYVNTYDAPVLRLNHGKHPGYGGGAAGEGHLIDRFPDENAVMPDEFLEPRYDSATVLDALAVCRKRDRVMIEQRYGLTDGAARTLEEVGELHGIGKERVRQVTDRALARMRRHLERRGYTGTTA